MERGLNVGDKLCESIHESLNRAIVVSLQESHPM